MQAINRDSENTVYFSAYTTDAHLLFAATHVVTRNTKYWLCSNDGTKSRPVAVFTENDMESLTNSIVTLTSGQWSVEVYSQNSSSNLDITTANYLTKTQFDVDGDTVTPPEPTGDNSYLCPVYPIAYLRNGWMGGYNPSQFTYDVGWYMANTTLFDYDTIGFAPIVDPNDESKLLEVTGNANAFGNYERFTNDLGGTVYDGSDGSTTDYKISHCNGLGWYQQYASSETWNEASTRMQTLTIGAYSDWRLPTEFEARTMLSKDAGVFLGVPTLPGNNYFYTMSSYSSSRAYAIRVNKVISSMYLIWPLNSSSSTVRTICVRNHY